MSNWTSSIKSSANFCHQVAAWVLNMLCKFFSTNNFAITEARAKINTDMKSLEFWEKNDTCLTKFKNHSNLLNKKYTDF